MSAPRDDEAVERELRRMTRRSFLAGGVAAALGGTAWAWLLSRPAAMGIPWPLRKALGANEALWRKLYRGACRAPESSPLPPGKNARVNGDIGLEDEPDLEAWRLRVVGRDGRAAELTLADLKARPRAEVTTNLNCIEGWSDRNTFAGVRFSELMTGLGLSRARYVGLETPDREYYVSLDLESMLQPQTLLVYEMDGRPLSPAHGAPLRLFTPVKYGIKCLKRVATIRLSDDRPPDYWAERGYDWYAGL